ncbi:unnamed protein product, partial [Symbiodinium sp. CCMP2456]
LKVLPGLYAFGQHDSLVAASASLRPTECWVEANLGKTRVLNAAGGDAPPGVDVLGPDVCSGNLPPEQHGFVALGVPRSHPDSVQAQAANPLTPRPTYSAKSGAWLLLAFCAAPRAQHLLRNVPPADILPYARGHDDAGTIAVWAVVESQGGDQGPGEGDDWAAARFASEPGRSRSRGCGAGFTGSILGGVGRAWAVALPVSR